MKKLLIGIAAVLVVIVAAALIGPRLVDGSRYRGEIAARIQDATGRALAIDGPISFELLPSPRLSIAGVRLANAPGAAVPDLARLKSLDLKIALLPLLGGSIQVESLELIEPSIELERFKDGRVNWQLTPAVERSSGNSVNLTGVDLGGSLGRLQLDNFAVRGGTIAYRDDRSGRHEELDRLDGDFAVTPEGPVNLHGQALTHGLPIAFDGTLERVFWFGPPDPRPVGLGLRIDAAGARLSLDGALEHPAGAYGFKGRVKLGGVDLRGSVRALGLDDAALLPGALAQSFAVEGDADWSEGALSFDASSVELGDNEATGTLNLRPGKNAAGPQRIDVKLAFERLDLDKAAAASPSSASSAPSAPAPPAPTPATPTSGAGLALPKHIEAHVDARVGALLYRGAAIRQAQLTLGLAHGELMVEKATAELPGDSDLTLYGTLEGSGAATPVFAGNLVLGSDNLRALMGWLGIDPGNVPAERLQKLTLNATLKAAPGRIEVAALDGMLDSSHLRGAGTILFGARPAYGISVAVDRLNLDAYLPQEGAVPAVGIPGAPGPGAAPAAASSPSFNPFADADGNLHARIDELIYRGQDILGLELDGSLEAGNLTLRDGRVDDLAGVAADVKGSLGGVPLSPKLDLAFETHAADLTGFLRFLELKSPIAPSSLGAMAFKGHLTGGLAGLDVDLAGTIAGADTTLSGKVGLDGGVGGGRGLGYDLTLAAKGPALGGFEIAAKAQGNPTTLALADLTGKIGGVGIAGALQVEFAGPRPKLTAKLATDRLDLDRTLGTDTGARVSGSSAGGAAPGSAPPWSTAPINILPLEVADADLALSAHELDYGQFKIADAQLAATLANGVLDLRALTGKLYGGDLKIAGKIDDAAGPGANVTLRLDGADLGAAGLRLAGLRLEDGAFQASADLASKGSSPAALVRALSGSGSFKLTRGTIEGFELAALGQRLDHPAGLTSILGLVQGAMAGGTTRVESLAGTVAIAGGIARNADLTLNAEGASGKGHGFLDLPHWNLDCEAAFLIEGAPGAPPFTVALKGAPDAPRKFINANALQEYMVQRIEAARKAAAPESAPAPAPAPPVGAAPKP